MPSTVASMPAYVFPVSAQPRYRPAGILLLVGWPPTRSLDPSDAVEIVFGSRGRGGLVEGVRPPPGQFCDGHQQRQQRLKRFGVVWGLGLGVRCFVSRV